MKQFAFLLAGVLSLALLAGCDKEDDYPDNVLIRNHRTVRIDLRIETPPAAKGSCVYEGSVAPSGELSLRLNNDNYVLDSHDFQVTEGRRTVITYMDGWFDIVHERL